MLTKSDVFDIYI